METLHYFQWKLFFSGVFYFSHKESLRYETVSTTLDHFSVAQQERSLAY